MFSHNPVPRIAERLPNKLGKAVLTNIGATFYNKPKGGDKMDENIVAFLIWAAMGAIFTAMGINAFFSKKPVGFWANAKQFKVNDIKKYNFAVGKLFIAFGIIITLLGLPILSGIDGLIIISILGTMFSTIAIMAVYMIVITPKFEKK